MHKNIFENHDYLHAETPGKCKNILKLNGGETFMKYLFLIYTMQSLLEKLKRYNNPEKQSTRKVHIFIMYTLFI